MPLCNADESLSSGQTFPPDAVSPEATVGQTDHSITRADTKDFARSVYIFLWFVQIELWFLRGGGGGWGHRSSIKEAIAIITHSCILVADCVLKTIRKTAITDVFP